MEKSREFSRSRENAVYHAGFPIDFRQTGKIPTVQISMSEDGTKLTSTWTTVPAKCPKQCGTVI